MLFCNSDALNFSPFWAGMLFKSVFRTVLEQQTMGGLFHLVVAKQHSEREEMSYPLCATSLPHIERTNENVLSKGTYHDNFDPGFEIITWISDYRILHSLHADIDRKEKDKTPSSR